MGTTRLADIPIVPLSNKKFEDLRQRDDVVSAVGGTPELGDRHSASAVLREAYTGMCDRFDLSKDDQRKAYAELTSKLYSGAEYVRLWEERIAGADGAYIVYVSYLRVMKVYQTGNDLFNLSENQDE